MHDVDETARAGLHALRVAVLQAAGVLRPATALPAPAELTSARIPTGRWLASDSGAPVRTPGSGHGTGPGTGPGSGQSSRHTGRPAGTDEGLSGRPDDDDPETARLVALVDLARNGDTEAFGQLYDHYVGMVYRFLYYRVSSHAVAEDLCSETFFRALRSMASFKWQGRDFGAWLMTISRNLVADHFKSGRQRLEMTTEDMSDHDTAQDGPEDDVIAGLTNELLLRSLRQLAPEQQDCLVLRFLQGMSIAETAAILQRTEGATKQLQLRATRNLAKLLPEGLRG